VVGEYYKGIKNKMGVGGLDYSGSGQGSVTGFLNMMLNFQLPCNMEDLWTRCENIRFSRRTLLFGVS
jgi:hypothetical protein